MRPGLIAVILLLSALFLLTDCGSKARANEFEVFDIEGKLHGSSEWIGRQPVVLNFWGTWCGPCRKEMPDLIRLYDEYSPKGVEILGLAVRDHPQKIANYAEQMGVKWVLLMADQKAVFKYGATRGVPTTVFLDRNGNELMRFIGAQPYEVLKTGFEAIAGS